MGMLEMMTMIKCPAATDLCAPPIAGTRHKTRLHKGCATAAIQLHGLMSHSSSNHIGIFEARGSDRQRERGRERRHLQRFGALCRMDKNSTSATAGAGYSTGCVCLSLTDCPGPVVKIKLCLQMNSRLREAAQLSSRRQSSNRSCSRKCWAVVEAANNEIHEFCRQ